MPRDRITEEVMRRVERCVQEARLRQQEKMLCEAKAIKLIILNQHEVEERLRRVQKHERESCQESGMEQLIRNAPLQN